MTQHAGTCQTDGFESVRLEDGNAKTPENDQHWVETNVVALSTEWTSIYVSVGVIGENLL